MKRSTRRRVLIGAAIYLGAAVLSANVVAAIRGEQVFGPDGAAPVLIAFGMLALMAYGIYAFRFRPRAEAGRDDASALRLRHSAKDRFGLRDLPFSMLDRLAPPSTIANVVWGRWEGYEVTAFDVWSAGRQFESSGEPMRGQAYRCALLPFPRPWPAIVVERERLTTRLADAVAMRDLTFESEAFNRGFEVRCADERFANALLDARMIAWLLDLDREWGFEARDGLLLGYTPIEGLDGAEPVLAAARGFLERVPPVAASLYPVSPEPPVAPPPGR